MLLADACIHKPSVKFSARQWLFFFAPPSSKETCEYNDTFDAMHVVDRH